MAYSFVADTSADFDTSKMNVGSNGIVTAGEALRSVGQQLGATATFGNFDDSAVNLIPSQLSGLTLGGVLDMFAESACGTWCGMSGNLELADLQNNADGLPTGASCTAYSEVDYQGVQSIGVLVQTNSNTGVTKTYGSGNGSVVTVENPVVADTHGWGSDVWSRMGGYQYQAWHCEKAILTSAPQKLLCCTMNFAGISSSLVVGDYTVNVDGTGIYFSGGRDPQPDERWGYQNKPERTKIGINKSVGNTTLTSSGRIEFRNKNKEV